MSLGSAEKVPRASIEEKPLISPFFIAMLECKFSKMNDEYYQFD